MLLDPFFPRFKRKEQAFSFANIHFVRQTKPPAVRGPDVLLQKCMPSGETINKEVLIEKHIKQVRVISRSEPKIEEPSIYFIRVAKDSPRPRLWAGQVPTRFSSVSSAVPAHAMAVSCGKK